MRAVQTIEVSKRETNQTKDLNEETINTRDSEERLFL